MVEATSTLKTGNTRILLLLRDGRAGMVTAAGAERLQVFTLVHVHP